MPGEVCIAIGNPYGYAFSLTDGRISAINREVGVNDSSLVYRNAIQTNTEINPGNSGGPLINVNGEMIGINVAIRQGATGIAFAIPVDQVVEVAAKLIGEHANQQVMHGLTISQIEPSNFETVRRFIIRVDSVESNSPAAQAGIQRGDFITGIGRHTLRNKLDFHRALLGLRPNEEIAFSFLRNDELHDVAVAVRSPRNGSMVATVNRNVSPGPAPAAIAPRTAGNTMTNEERASEWDRLVWENLGIRSEQIPAQEYRRIYPQFILAKDADFSNGGVVVRTVRPGSPAAQAGITTGDFIVGVDPLVAGLGPWEIASANDLRFVGAQEWTRLQSRTDTIQVDVIRDSKHYAAEISLR
jgi:serine protease Do